VIQLLQASGSSQHVNWAHTVLFAVHHIFSGHKAAVTGTAVKWLPDMIIPTILYQNTSFNILKHSGKYQLAVCNIGKVIHIIRRKLSISTNTKSTRKEFYNKRISLR
jgi:hypothetical protein